MIPFKDDAKNLLQHLKNQHDKKTSPHFYEANGPIRGSWDFTTANGLTRACIDLLTFIGAHGTRVNTMGVPIGVQGGKVKFRPSTTREGTADIISCIRGRYVAIEVKAGKDRQSKEQKQEEARVIAAGGEYLILNNFGNFVTELKNKFDLSSLLIVPCVQPKLI
jgi:hypothetical protein